MGRSSAFLLFVEQPYRADMPLQRHEFRWVPVPEGTHDAASVDAVLATRAGGGRGFERLDALPLEPSKPLLRISTATRSLRACDHSRSHCSFVFMSGNHVHTVGSLVYAR